MTDVEELRYLILALQREGNRMLAADLRPLDLTPAQAEVLSVLAAREPLTLAGLGELLVCESGSSPSRLVDRLVGMGLVQRQEDPDDRRFVTLSLTAEGVTAERRAAAVQERLHATLADWGGNASLGPVLRVLRRMAAPTPGGQALQRRTESAGLLRSRS